MSRSVPSPLAGRLEVLRASAHCRRYFERVALHPGPNLQLSVYGSFLTDEVFVEVTDGHTAKVQAFRSQLANVPAEERVMELPLVDLADAFALARQIGRAWPEEPGGPDG